MPALGEDTNAFGAAIDCFGDFPSRVLVSCCPRLVSLVFNATERPSRASFDTAGLFAEAGASAGFNSAETEAFGATVGAVSTRFEEAVIDL